MLENVILVILLVVFFSGLMEKWNLDTALQSWASGSNSKFLYRLSQCEFCIDFHLSWISTLLVGVCLGYEWGMILVPFIASGGMIIINKWAVNGY